MDIYCEGTQCKRRNSCALHCDTKENEIYQYLDYSTQGSARYDDNGPSVLEHWCGDAGEYRHYEKANRPLSKIKIEDIRKKPYENWIHYKYEEYNNCPICNGTLHMTGQVSQYQGFKCTRCGKEFELNAFTEEIIFKDKQ